MESTLTWNGANLTALPIGERFRLLPDHLKFIVINAQKHLSVQRIWLFGSRAREDASPKSDFDLAFEFKQNKKISWAAFCVDTRERVPSLYQYDLIDLAKVDTPLKEEVLKEGLLIYEQKRKLKKNNTVSKKSRGCLSKA